MAVFKCKMCGGDLATQENATICECEFCGTKQTVPTAKTETLANLFNRANKLRLKCEFDKAEEIYEKILGKDETLAEAHWGLVLCKYGIEYVEDPLTEKRIPTCHRTSYESVTSDTDYLSAVEYADSEQKKIYKAEAKAIEQIQKRTLEIVKNEKPFDVFICYKETDKKGKRTVDSTYANDIYHQLTSEGFKVFYAAITLEDKLGQEYEPYIFAALNSAKVMLVIGSKEEYFNAVWVKNEWSRFLKLMKTDRSKLLIPCYKDIDPYDLPEEFAHLQAQDMGKIGFVQDLLRGIRKVVKTEEKTAPATIIQNSTDSVEPLLKRAELFLKDGDWHSVYEYCEKVLDKSPECFEAYLYKFFADVKVHNLEELKNVQEPISNNLNYKKILDYCNDELRGKLTEISNLVSYNCAGKLMENDNYRDAIKIYEEIYNYKDSLEKFSVCKEKVKEIQEEFNSLILAKEEKKKLMLEDFENLEINGKKYKRNGWISMAIGFVIMLSAFLFIEALEYGALVLVYVGVMVVAIVFPVLWSKGNKKLLKIEKEKNLMNLQLNNEFKPTEQMQKNIDIDIVKLILKNKGEDYAKVLSLVSKYKDISLAEAKYFVESLPNVLVDICFRADANEIKKQFLDAGALVEEEKI